MKATELKELHKRIRKARAQRNATTNDEDFDYWDGILERELNKLQTGETNA